MNILFVCTGNTCRSPMAAALFDRISTERNLDVRIESAGIFATKGDGASSGAISAMERYGIDISGHSAQPVTGELIGVCDLILTMTKAQKNALSGSAPDKVYTLCEFAGADGDIPDPYSGDDGVYEKCAQRLMEILEKAAERIENN